MQGYNELRGGAAWLDVSGRGKIRVADEDRARLLHAMTTNHIQQLTPGTGCYAFFLTAQGRILTDVNVLCRQDSFLLDTEPETLRKLLEHLDKIEALARCTRMKTHFESCVWNTASHAMEKISASATSHRKRTRRMRCISIKVAIWARRSLNGSDRAG